MSGSFVPTHRVPDVGMPFWSAPEASAAAAGRLDPRVPVVIAEQRGDWARVVCSNGWSGWVDGRALIAGAVSPAPAATVAAPAANPTWAAATTAPDRLQALPGLGWLTIAGMALVILGSFLDWWSKSGFGDSAWDFPLLGLVSDNPGAEGIKIGLALLVVLGAAVPLVTKKPLPPQALVALGAWPVLLAVVGIVRNADLDVNPGLGLFAVLIGGALVAADGGRHLIKR
jgi:hypothetical protein